MDIILQLVMNGLAMGSIYSLVAMGITLIYSAVARVNFSQAQVLMIGAYVGLTFVASLRLPLPLTFACTLVILGLFGIGFERIAYRPTRQRPRWAFMITTIGMMILLENVAMVLWSPIPQYFPLPFGGKMIDVGGVRIMPQHALILAATGFAMVGQTFLFNRTLLGKMMRASAQDQQAASLMGINVARMTQITFVLACALAGLGGLLVAPLFFLTPQMGSAVGLRAFASSLIGGFGNAGGAIIGGLLVGLMEVMFAAYVSSVYRDVFVFAILILFLIVRPQGIFGEPISEKA